MMVCSSTLLSAVLDIVRFLSFCQFGVGKVSFDRDFILYFPYCVGTLPYISLAIYVCLSMKCLFLSIPEEFLPTVTLHSPSGLPCSFLLVGVVWIVLANGPREDLEHVGVAAQSLCLPRRGDVVSRKPNVGRMALPAESAWVAESLHKGQLSWRVTWPRIHNPWTRNEPQSWDV